VCFVEWQLGLLFEFLMG